MKRLKIILWKIKESLKWLFIYPVKNISTKGDVDYDSYWKERKGDKIFMLNSWQKKRADLVVSFIKDDEAISIADIASGAGNILGYIKERVPTKTAMALDVSKDAVSVAKENGLDARVFDIGEKYALGSIENQDYFLLFEILEHIPHAEMVLDSIYQHAVKGVFLSVPNTGYITHRLRLLLGRFPLQWRQYPNEHVRFWTLADMKWWLKAQGYDQARIISYEGVPILNKIWPSLFAGGIWVYIPKVPKLNV